MPVMNTTTPDSDALDQADMARLQAGHEAVHHRFGDKVQTRNGSQRGRVEESLQHGGGS